MADTDKTIKELPLTTNVNDNDDIIVEDDSPTTYRIKAYDLKSYITNEVQEQVTGALKDIESNTNLITQNTNGISKLNSALAAKSNLLSTSTFTLDNQTIAASSSSSFTINISRSGYTSLGIVGFRIGSSSSGSGTTSNLNVYGVFLSNSTTFNINVRNLNTSSCDFLIWCQILYYAN